MKPLASVIPEIYEMISKAQGGFKNMVSKTLGLIQDEFRQFNPETLKLKCGFANNSMLYLEQCRKIDSNDLIDKALLAQTSNMFKNYIKSWGSTSEAQIEKDFKSALEEESARAIAILTGNIIENYQNFLEDRNSYPWILELVYDLPQNHKKFETNFRQKLKLLYQDLSSKLGNLLLLKSHQQLELLLTKIKAYSKLDSLLDSDEKFYDLYKTHENHLYSETDQDCRKVIELFK